MRWVAPALLLALSTVLLQFFLQGAYGFSLWDEGYLWYGVQRVLAGEVPVRDFQSYDPGRYYWSAAWLWLYGDDGILSLRFSVMLFQCLGLFCALLSVMQGRCKRATEWSVGALLIIAVIVVAWMFPRHKLFDVSASFVSLAALTAFVRCASSRSAFVLGLVVGLIAVIGRNHGAYAAFAASTAMILLATERGGLSRAARLAPWCAVGVFCGYLPLLLMLAFVNGFARSFIDGIRFLLEIGATNLSLPVPWPWTAGSRAASVPDLFYQVAVGAYFCLLVCFPLFAFVGITRVRLKGRRMNPVITASALLSLPYAHFAFSRADVGHLAQGIGPALIGTLVAAYHLSPRWRIPMVTVLLATSTSIALMVQPRAVCWLRVDCVPTVVDKDLIYMDRQTASDVAMLKTLSEKYASDGRAIYVAPFWPGAYAVTRRKSPVYEIFPLFPRSAEFQASEIMRLKRTDIGIVILFDLALDGREELRFRNTHPEVYDYLAKQYVRRDLGYPAAYELFVSR